MAPKSTIIYLRLALIDGENDQPYINKLNAILHHQGMLPGSPSRATLHVATGDKEYEILAKFDEPVSIDEIGRTAGLCGWEVLECASTEQEVLT